jgi:uncharacterized protein (DUF2237 family)
VSGTTRLNGETVLSCDNTPKISASRVGRHGGHPSATTGLGLAGTTRTSDPLLSWHGIETGASDLGDTDLVSERNVLGGELEPCGLDPVTGFYRDGSCRTGQEDLGSHTICAVVTEDFLDHQRRIGNDLSTPMPAYRFPGLKPGDRWCVTAANWLRAHLDGAACYVVLAATHEEVLTTVPLAILEEHAVDVPESPGDLGV